MIKTEHTAWKPTPVLVYYHSFGLFIGLRLPQQQPQSRHKCRTTAPTHQIYHSTLSPGVFLPTMNNQTPAAAHRHDTNACPRADDRAETTPHGTNQPPPVSTVACNGTSPASTIGLASATHPQPRRSARQDVSMQSTEPSVASIVHYGQSVMDNEENPPVLGGASMQPSSPQKKDDNLPFALNAVGIPISKPSRKIKIFT